jgi:hypothetical protein
MLDHQSLHVADLTKFGMQRVAQMNLLDDGATIQTTFVLPEAKKWCCTIYAIVFGDVVERIGASKNTLLSRCRQTDRILSRKFRDPHYDGASDRELPIWQECFKRNETGEVYATSVKRCQRSLVLVTSTSRSRTCCSKNTSPG